MNKLDLFIAIPLLGMLAVFQAAVLNQIPLIMGTADILLLTVIAWSLRDRVRTAWHWSVVGGYLASISSALPYGVLILSYLIITGTAIFIRKRFWKIPILAMLLTTFLGTIFVQIAALVSRIFSGVTIQISQAINLIILPTLILNIILAIPIHLIIADLAGWLYKDEIQV